MLKSALLLTAGVIAGLGVAQLSAATGPSVYTVYEANVTDEAAYKAALSDAQNLIKDNGGIYIAGGFNKAKTNMGAAVGNRYVIIRWENQATWEKAWDGGIKAWIAKNAPQARNITVEGLEATK
jgi:uncharacterized protein (DUF1330 family)